MFTKLLPVLVICIGLHGIQARRSTNVLNRVAPNMGSRQQHSDQMTRDATDICDRYDVDGCSIPGGLPYFDKVTFTPSCNRHDICYHCGVSYNDSKTVCDNFFYKNMVIACSNSYMSEVSLPLKAHAQLRKRQIVQVFREHHSEFESAVDRHLNMKDIAARVSNIDDFWKYAQVFRQDIITEWARILSNHLTKNYINAHQSFLIDILQENEDTNRPSSIEALINDEIANLGKPLVFCELHAKEYWLGVTIFGKSSYHTKPEFYCDEKFVPKCLELIH